MSKNSAMHQKKVEHAMRVLLNRWTGGVEARAREGPLATKVAAVAAMQQSTKNK
jgi:hypothetical protein